MSSNSKGKRKRRLVRKPAAPPPVAEFWGIGLVLAGLVGLIGLSLPHGGGVLGRGLAGMLGRLLGALGAPLMFGLLFLGGGMIRTRRWPLSRRHEVAVGLLLAGTLLLLGLLHTGGQAGGVLANIAVYLLGPWGAPLLLLPLLSVTLWLFTPARSRRAPSSWQLSDGVDVALHWGRRVLTAAYALWQDEPVRQEEPRGFPQEILPAIAPAIRGGTRAAWEAAPAAEVTIPEPEPLPVTAPDPPPPPPPGAPYQVPPLTILHRGETRGDGSRSDGGDRRRLLEETLASFGVQARVVDYVQGPTVTRFELQPAPGVKVSRIVNLSDDIALAMAARDVRIEAPIPGKSALGIEIPNAEVAPVFLREILESIETKSIRNPLAVGLGKDIAGQPIVAHLDRMPHLLIAGATGAGKSVCINAIIASLLFRVTPEEVRLLLVDPKVVELSQYNGLPHLLAPVVTDAKKAAGVLRGVVRQMEYRYEAFAKAGVRDIGRYNQQAEEPFPFIVVIIDELADLMMVAPGDVEDAICRLAQMARAAGIHLVVATQRPSVDVITGLIKANIPSRVAFAVSSQVDSRTILDSGGAEKLLGKGDMLYAPLGAGKPIRAQGVYVSEQEIEHLTDYIRQQVENPAYEEEWTAMGNQEAEGPRQETDPLFLEALKVVVEARQASASLLQRRLRVGYSRAARLVDAMEERGFVGPAEGAKPREVRLGVAELARLLQEGESRPTA